MAYFPFQRRYNSSGFKWWMALHADAFEEWTNADLKYHERLHLVGVENPCDFSLLCAGFVWQSKSSTHEVMHKIINYAEESFQRDRGWIYFAVYKVLRSFYCSFNFSHSSTSLIRRNVPEFQLSFDILLQNLRQSDEGWTDLRRYQNVASFSNWISKGNFIGKSISEEKNCNKLYWIPLFAGKATTTAWSNIIIVVVVLCYSSASLFLLRDWCQNGRG